MQSRVPVLDGAEHPIGSFGDMVAVIEEFGGMAVAAGLDDRTGPDDRPGPALAGDRYRGGAAACEGAISRRPPG
ncbi:hypothetical protein ACFCVY_10070 [Streptomyces sp. NPDC056411]|uniref:hypothetical protein n=1 Tax=Streptomyces sp. NPDC056411 TaxID=3345813 RepID=UPI0035D93BB0